MALGALPSRLSVIGRQCLAAICVERFCLAHGITDPMVEAFVEHLWSIATVDDASLTEWEQHFQELPGSAWGDRASEALRMAIPDPLLVDYIALAEAAIECSAATWYGSDIPGTIAAFEIVLRIMRAHELAVPDFEPFYCSSPRFAHGWGNRPSPEQLQLWHRQR